MNDLVVAEHGSRNATRDPCSRPGARTRPGTSDDGTHVNRARCAWHKSVETVVPRATLIVALERRMTLVRTDTLTP